MTSLENKDNGTTICSGAELCSQATVSFGEVVLFKCMRCSKLGSTEVQGVTVVVCPRCQFGLCIACAQEVEEKAKEAALFGEKAKYSLITICFKCGTCVEHQRFINEYTWTTRQDLREEYENRNERIFLAKLDDVVGRR